MIYKKGKKHRVLVCPQCGVLATNPTIAGKILKAGVSAIPVVGGVASSIIGDIQAGKEAKPKTATARPTHGREYYAYKSHMLDEALH